MQPTHMRIAIDGEVFDEHTARISVLDRGFLYGDSVYEVLRTYGGRPFAVDEHLGRLARSAAMLEMALPVTRDELAEEIRRTVAAAGHPESYVRVIVTRGSGPIGLDPALAERPCRVVLVAPLHPLPEDLYQRGESIRLVQTGRCAEGDLAPGAKSGNYLTNLLALGQARQQGAGEAVMLDSRGRVAEGASSNIFVWRQGDLCTPPLSVGILEGITRGKVMSLARDLGLRVNERGLTAAEVAGADEVFLTSTLREILPVTRVDDRPVGTGHPGPVTKRLRAEFLARVRGE